MPTIPVDSKEKFRFFVTKLSERFVELSKSREAGTITWAGLLDSMRRYTLAVEKRYQCAHVQEWEAAVVHFYETLRENVTESVIRRSAFEEGVEDA